MEDHFVINDFDHLGEFREEDAIGPVQRHEALFLLGLIRLLCPKVVVEFGFRQGHSALNFLKALGSKGELYSYDTSRWAASQAAHKFSMFGNFHFIRKSQELFSPSDIGGRLIDFVFIDASHDLMLNQRTFGAVLPALGSHAIIAVHDTGTWQREFLLPAHAEFATHKPDDWLNATEFQHQKEERIFVNWIAENYPSFQLLHFHSANCLRHGITLIQRQRVLETCLR